MKKSSPKSAKSKIQSHPEEKLKTDELKSSEKGKKSGKPQGPSLISLLKPYRGWIILLVILAFASNGISLTIPRIVSGGIDAFTQETLDIKTLIIEFFVAALFIFIIAYGQSVVQTYASEKVARDLREQLAAKISRQSYLYIQEVTPSKLLTNLTSDINAIKMFVAQAIVSICSSVFLIIGASTLLLLTNWKLALAVLLILPIIGGTFFFVLSKVRVLFKKTQEIIDWLNKVINESILGSSLIRVLNSQKYETEKFVKVNTEAKNNSLKILKLFSGLIPIITFVASIANLIIVTLGGHFVIEGSMTIGSLAAFNSYVSILIFPIILIGFMSNVIARSQASYQRISEILNAQEKPDTGTITDKLHGDIELENVSLRFGEKPALKNVSFKVKGGTRTAVIGPTAAGKTQLLYLLTGLTVPDEGVVKYDSQPIDDYDKVALHEQIGIVFQDSIIFNLTVRENIAFNNKVKDEDLKKAIDTAELRDFIDELPDGLNTIVSERGTSLSGGQKQRIMLARALALNPKILLLDDFTARVDTQTEHKILNNVHKNYPGITLLSVTQKIASVENYDQIIVLMEGEVLAKGTHDKLMETSPEYVQIFNSQRSTSHYEVQS